MGKFAARFAISLHKRRSVTGVPQEHDLLHRLSASARRCRVRAGALAQALAEGIAETDGPAVLPEEIAKRLVAEVDEVLAEVATEQLDGLHDDTVEDNAFCRHS